MNTYTQKTLNGMCLCTTEYEFN